MKAKNYQLAVITAAVNAGFEFDMDDSMADVEMQAQDYLLENEPYGHVFEHIELSGHGMSQNYSWADEDSDYSTQMSGEIFGFGENRAEDEVYFHREENGTFTPVNWFDIPNEFEKEERRQYIFVFDKQVRSDGKIAWLYDYMA